MKFSSTLAYVFLSIALSGSTFAGGSDRSLRVAPNIVLPKDQIERQNLTASLNDFLLAAQKPNEENEFVFDSERIETFIQLDEMKGIEKSSESKEDFFYKPYLTNVVLLKEKSYLIQVSYIGIKGDLALLRASFEFFAHRRNGSFTFSSPLLRNTADWKVKRVGKSIFHYRNTINEKRVKEFNELTSLFDLKLKVPKKVTDYYCTGTTTEMQKLIGIDYKSDYNGQAEGVRSSEFGDRKVIVLGNDNSTFDAFDPHDLFHDRLSLMIPRSKVNRPVDEGYAYLYGGSWGFTWKQIFKAFKEQIASNKNANWTEI